MTTAMELVGEGMGLGFAQAFRDKAVRASEIGQEHLANNRLDKAIASFTDAIQTDPSYLAGRLLRAMALLRASHWEAAAKDASVVLAEGQAMAEAHAIRGLAYQGWAAQSGKPELLVMAENDLRAAKELNPAYIEIPTMVAGDQGATTPDSSMNVDWGKVGGIAWSFLKGTAAVAGIVAMAAGPHLAKGIGESFDRSRRGGFDCPNCGTFIHGHGTGHCPRCNARTY
jgi:tetratricopeptide (TPR) repeat protein